MFYNIAAIMLLVGVMSVILGIVLAVVWQTPKLSEELSGRRTKKRVKALQQINQKGSGNVSTSDLYMQEWSDIDETFQKLGVSISDVDRTMIPHRRGRLLRGKRGIPTEDLVGHGIHSDAGTEVSEDTDSFIPVVVERKPESNHPVMGTVWDDEGTGVYTGVLEDLDEDTETSPFSAPRAVLILTERSSVL